MSVLFPDPVSTDLYIEMCARYQIKGLPVHDFEIAAISLSNQINKLVTVNRKDFNKIEELQIITPD